MIMLQAFVVGFVLFSFVEESFQEGFVRAIDMKAPGRMRAICESLCRSKREDGPHSKQEVSLEVCFSKCIRNKRSVMDSSRSRRNTNQQPSSEDECTTPKEYVRYYPLQPSSINVDYLTRKPNLSITWKPVRQDPYYNWTSYALHYFNGEEEDDHRLNPGVCKVLPKEQHEFIVQNGEGWNYPERIWVVIVTYPFGQYDGFKMQEFGPPPPSPPTFPPKESSDGTTKLIAATIGAVSGVVLLLVFIFLAYRNQMGIVNICKRGGEQRNVFVNPRNNNRRVPLTGDVEDNCVMSPKINNDLQFTDPKKKTSGPDTFYACYFAESQWFQVQVASVVNYFRHNGYAVEMDVMNSSERIDLGPTRWAEQQIKKARNVLVFLSPGLLRMCGGDGEETDSSHQEHDRLWYELDILRKIYAQTHSARKMVCIILPNMNIDPADLPLWAEMRYKWPEDEMNILKRLNDRPIIQPW